MRPRFALMRLAGRRPPRPPAVVLLPGSVSAVRTDTCTRMGFAGTAMTNKRSFSTFLPSKQAHDSGGQNTTHPTADPLLAKVPRKPLVVALDDSHTGKTLHQILIERIPQKQVQHYLVAVDEAGTLYSLQDTAPAEAGPMSFLSFADPRGQQALWWHAAHLLGAALRALHGDRIRLASPVQMLQDGTFALQFFRRGIARLAGESTTSSGASSDRLEQCATVLQDSSEEAATLLRSIDLAALEKEMKRLASEAFERQVVTKEDAQALFADNPFKQEQLDSIQSKTVCVVTLGEHVDLLPADSVLSGNADALQAVKLLDKSTATWKPVVSTVAQLPTTQSLVRIRGMAYPTSDMLKARFTAMEEAHRMDHRTIGHAQRLFFTHDSSPGTPFILPHGMRIVGKVERVIRDLYRRWDYNEVLTPQVFKAELWKRSGHWDNYREDMFAVEGFKEMQERAQAGHAGGCCGDAAHTHAAQQDAGQAGDEAAYGLKPMNCPGHCLLYAAQEHSYRDLPIRYAEFSPLHRNEASGALTGLTRVRRFHQDDAHVFCRVDQIFDEIASMLAMLQDAYMLFGFAHFELALSTRPAQYLGELADWERAEDSLREALDSSGLRWTLNEADGAFYGPKIDIRLVDAAGRRHQTATIQLDFQLPRRFDLRYTSFDGSSERPVMIHRAILGSMERFMAILIENLAGRWPFWLSPRQAVVLPTSSDDPVLVACAQAVRDQLALGMVPGHSVNRIGKPSWTEEQTAEVVKAYLPSRTARTSIEIEKMGADVWQQRRQRRQPHTFHVDVDASDDKLAKRVRKAHLDRVNFTCVIGPEEVRAGTVQVRSRDQHPGDQHGRPELQQKMGAFTVEDLRQLFITLDDHHW